MISSALVIRVPGEPVAQPRTKAARCGIFVRVYMPTTANLWKDQIAHFAQRAAQSAGWAGPTAKMPLCVNLEFHFRRPSGYRKSEGYKFTKPDADNLAKAALDALVWSRVIRDDAQVVDLHVVKVIDDDWQGAVITISEIEPT